MKKTQRLASIQIQKIIRRARFLLIGLFLIAGLMLFATQWRKTQTTHATAVFATFTVTNTNNSGAGSLRQAILDANANAGADIITFNISPGGVQTIAPTSALPTISGPVTIDGTTQLGYSGTPLIELSGASAGGSGINTVDGLRITGGGSTVLQLAINRFSGDGIELNGASGNIVEGCYIGTDLGGMLDQGNVQYGVNIVASTNNTIGGATADKRNVISGNNFGGVQIDFGTNIVQGNYIGTNKDGEATLGNSGHGITVQGGGAVNNTIIGNVISGNASNGIWILNGPTGSIIRGNLIGTDKDGDTDLGNAADGILIGSGTNNIVGGATAADRNVISGNNGTGLALGVNLLAQGVTVQGNYIGTNSAGTAALGNSIHGITVGGNTTIGGTTGTTPGGNCTGACNLISGNGQNGIVSNGNTLVLGNYIGTDVTGNVDLGNTQSGVALSNGASGLAVGGTTPEARNVISGNNQYGILLVGGGGTIQGNIIGLNVTGASDLGNGLSGVLITNFSAGNLIGGTAAGAGNLISGNDEDGVKVNATLFSPSINTIQGNLIGTDVTGTLDRGNTRHGIAVSSSFLTIGGTTAAARNVISGNNGNGIGLDPGSTGGQDGMTVLGNYIGTDASGTAGLGNGGSGIYFTGAPNALIGGTVMGAGNVISANGGNGITAYRGTIQGNYIGTDKNGLTVSGLGNNLNGIKLGDAGSSANGVTIGGATAAARNVIAGNSQNGIELTTSSTNTSIKGNYIGQNTLNGVQATQVTGVNANTIGGTATGEGNTITGNGENGVQVRSTINVAIRGNSIYGNTKLGIDLAPTLPGGTVTPNDANDSDGGPNLLQNFPVLNAITQPCTVTGSLDSTTTSAAYPVRIDFYASTSCDAAGNGEGEVYLGSLPSPLTAPGNFSFSFTPVAGKPVITATATDNNGNTSEFSACRTAPVNQAPVITPASVTRVEGQPGANSTIASITDANQASNTLAITINGQPLSPSPTLTVNGVTISNLAINAAGALTADIVAACGAMNAGFTLAATDNCGATTSGTLTVMVTPAPAPMASAGIDQAMCSAGATTTFTLAGSAANGAAAWSVVSGPVSITNPGALNSTAVFTGAGSATLRLTVTGACATATDDVVLTVNPPPNADAGPGRTLTCAATSVTLNGSSTSPGATFSWSGPGGFTSNAAAAVVSAAGVYTLTVTSAAGCTASDTVTVTSDTTAPNADAGADKTLTCSTTSVVLDGSSTTPGATFNWNGPGGFTSNAAAPTVSAAGIYMLTVTNPANGCTASDSVTVTANTAAPDATLTVVSEVCANAAGIVASVPNAGPGAAYGWTLTNGTVTSGGGSPSITFTAGASGVVSITVGVQGGNDCFTSSSKTVTIKPATAVTVPPSNQAVCAGNSAPVSFAVTAAGTNLGYAWTLDGNMTGGNAANTAIDPSSLPVGNHTVSVTVTGDCGAPVTASATLAINANPSAVITAPTTVCSTSSGNTASAPDAGAGASYAWTITNGTITAGAGSQQITWSAGASGTATLDVTVTNANGCGTSSSKLVTIDAAFTPTITGSAEICSGQSATLDAGAGYSGYLWSNGATTQTITVSPNATTIYSVTVTNAAGCSGSATKTVSVNPQPVVAVNSAAICAGASPATMTATVTSGTAPFSYLWSGPGSFTASTQSINVSTAGSYTVNVTDAKGCAAASASGTLTVNPTPSATIAAPTVVCANSTGNTSSVADAGVGASYAWTITGGAITSGQNTSNITWSAGTSGMATLGVTVTNAAGCSVTATPKTVTINQPPSLTSLTNVTVSAGSAASFTTTASGAGSFIFVWKRGATVLATSGNITITSTATTSTLNIASAIAADAGNYSVEVTGTCGSATSTAALTVNSGCGTPVVSINAPASGAIFPVGTPISFVGAFSDATGATHTANWNFTSNLVNVNQAGTVNDTTSTVSANYTFPQAGVYLVTLTVTNNCGNSGSANSIGADELSALVVVYDPNAGHVTGGGWINSPPGAYVPNPSLTGKANFGFVSKYKNGASVPDGNTEFQFKAGNLNFKSTVYEWLVIAGARAQFKGSGTINNAGDYRFILTAIDGQQPGGGGQDKFRIRIWNNAGGGQIYDNQLNTPDSDDPTTVLGGGSIVIHKNSGGNGALRATVDFDGDGKTDFANWDNYTHEWRIVRTSDGLVQTVPWIENYTPNHDAFAPGDYDGDGLTDLAVFYRADGNWLIKRSSDGEFVTRQFGIGTDTPVAADYDGDGKTDIAIWRGSEGLWLILRSSNGEVETALWGSASAPYFDIPVAADFDGDGKTDIAVFRRANGRWYIRQGSDK